MNSPLCVLLRNCRISGPPSWSTLSSRPTWSWAASGLRSHGASPTTTGRKTSRWGGSNLEPGCTFPSCPIPSACPPACFPSSWEAPPVSPTCRSSTQRHWFLGPTRVPHLSLSHTKSLVLGPAPAPSLTTPLPDAPPNRTTGTPPSAPRRPPAEEGNPPCSTPTPACTPPSRTMPSGARPSGGNCLTRPGPSAPTALTGHRATGGLFTPRCPPP